eukprot:876950-Alexandrium_andersonii.AAC.1
MVKAGQAVNDALFWAYARGVVGLADILDEVEARAKTCERHAVWNLRSRRFCNALKDIQLAGKAR